MGTCVPHALVRKAEMCGVVGERPLRRKERGEQEAELERTIRIDRTNKEMIKKEVSWPIVLKIKDQKGCAASKKTYRNASQVGSSGTAEPCRRRATDAGDSSSSAGRREEAKC